MRDLGLNLAVLEDVAIHLGEGRVAVREAPQQDDELEQIRVRLLPERLLRLAEQVVDQRRDGVGNGVRIEIVVERVVADVATEADLGVVRGTSGTREHPVHLLAEVALDFEDKAANLALGIAGLPAEELVGVRDTCTLMFFQFRRHRSP